MTKTPAELWFELQDFQKKRLAIHGVKPLPHFANRCKQLQLTCLWLHYGRPVHKDNVARWVQQHNPDCGLDPQAIRAWARDHGWPIYSGDKGDLDANGQELPRSCYVLMGTNPRPAWLNNRTRESGRLSAVSFRDLCAIHRNHCGMCGRRAPLQQGHLDPRQPLDLANSIPLCQDCNLWQSDRFVISENGRIVTILPHPKNASLFEALTPREQQAIQSLLARVGVGPGG